MFDPLILIEFSKHLLPVLMTLPNLLKYLFFKIVPQGTLLMLLSQVICEETKLEVLNPSIPDYMFC